MIATYGNGKQFRNGRHFAASLGLVPRQHTTGDRPVLLGISKVSPALFMALGARLYTSLGLANRVGPPFSTVVTNVPGPPVKTYSSGARLESMMGLLAAGRPFNRV